MFSSLLLGVLLCACVVLWYRARVRESHAHPLPPALPHRLPIIGHLHYFFTDAAGIWKTFEFYINATLEQGGVIYTYIGPHIFYSITDPEDAVTVANSCLDKNSMYSLAQSWFGQGLITASAPIWQRHRKLLNPMFSLPVIHGFLEVFNSQARVLLNSLDPFVGRGKFDTASHIKKITLETSLLTVFGESDDKKLLSKYILNLQEFIKILIQRYQKFWLLNDTIYKLLGQRRKEALLINTLIGVSESTAGVCHAHLNVPLMVACVLDHLVPFNMVELDDADACVMFVNGRRQLGLVISSRHAKFFIISKLFGIGSRTFVDYMLPLTNNDTLTDQEIREELDTTLVASYDTSYNTVINMLALIGSYPEIQGKIYEEIMQVVGPEGDVEKKHLQKLVYMDAVIKETIRLTPPIPLIARYIDKDVKLKNYTLRKGSDCFIFLFGINRHPSWGADADQFRPERWLDDATLPKNANSFAGFGLGKRSCIGKTYAMTSAKVLLAHVLRKYRITSDHTKMQFIYDITLKSKAGHEIDLELRN